MQCTAVYYCLMQRSYVVRVKWHAAGSTGDGDDRGSMDKQERMMASMREREKVVQQSLSMSLRERDREREQHLKEEAMQHFSALMADMVTDCCLTSFFFWLNEYVNL